MKTMEWSNLRDFKCPYCNNPLEHSGGEIRCTYCRFHIEKKRFKSIAANRVKNPTNKIDMHWQNLIESRCPVCGSMLRPDNDGKSTFQKCINPECTFRISDTKAGEILNDQKRNSNIIYNKEHDEYKQ